MIITLLLNVVIMLVGAIFSIFPQVAALPEIAGYDIDAALVNGVGQFKFFIDIFWPLTYIFQGFLFIMGYYVIKMGLRFLLGHRSIQ